MPGLFSLFQLCAGYDFIGRRGMYHNIRSKIYMCIYIYISRDVSICLQTADGGLAIIAVYATVQYNSIGH